MSLTSDSAQADYGLQGVPATEDRKRCCRMTLCLEDRGNETGMVRDVGFIGQLTRCRPGLTGMVATRGGYRAGQSSVLAILPTGAI